MIRKHERLWLSLVKLLGAVDWVSDFTKASSSVVHEAASIVTVDNQTKWCGGRLCWIIGAVCAFQR